MTTKDTTNSTATGDHVGLPRSDDGYVEFSTSIAQYSENNLLVATATAAWERNDESQECLWVAGQELARATVWAYDAVDHDPDDLGETLENLVEECDVVSQDLYQAASAVAVAYENGELQGDEMYDYTKNWLILDSVEVHESLRGFGLGRTVAAYALYTAGAWCTDAAIASIAGARLDSDKAPLDDALSPAYSAAWNAQQKRSALLLEGLGLSRLPSGVYIGHLGYIDVNAGIRDSLPERYYDLPWEAS